MSRDGLEAGLLIVLPSVSDKPIGSGTISDITANTAVRRLKIAAQIEEIKLYKETLNHALKSLTEDERALIEGFYYPKKAIGDYVNEYGNAHGINKDYVYVERARVEQKMARIIEARYSL